MNVEETMPGIKTGKGSWGTCEWCRGRVRVWPKKAAAGGCRFCSRECYAKYYGKAREGETRMADCHPTRKHVARGLCGACYQARSRVWRKRATCHPDRPHSARGLCVSCASRSRVWGVAPAVMLKFMTGPAPIACEMCGGPAGKRGFQLDHDHKSHVIRGWLCERCNLGLSFFEERPNFGELAAVYLAIHGFIREAEAIPS